MVGSTWLVGLLHLVTDSKVEHKQVRKRRRKVSNLILYIDIDNNIIDHIEINKFETKNLNHIV